VPEKTDSNGSNGDELEELKSRLARGGLSPEAVDKAADAYIAGDIHALNLAYVGNGAKRRLICPIPDELLTRVFPELDVGTDPGLTNKDLQSVFLEYEINRHRGDVRSLTIRYPETLRKDETEPEQPEREVPEGFTRLEEKAPAKTTEAPLDDPNTDPWPPDDGADPYQEDL
jgi:hypothetical protein